MAPYDSLLLQIAPYGLYASQWLHMEPYVSILLPMASFGSQCLLMTANGLYGSATYEKKLPHVD